MIVPASRLTILTLPLRLTGEMRIVASCLALLKEAPSSGVALSIRRSMHPQTRCFGNFSFFFFF